MAGRVPIPVTLAAARRAWLAAQRLDREAPFGAGADAVRLATEHLGYVQIDTINVIERAHHHILWSRIPAYRPADLATAQSVDRSVFEYWAHALAYLPTRDYRVFVPAMDRYRARPHSPFTGGEPAAYAALLRRIRTDGALTIRDIDDAVLVDKVHPWASRKPSKRMLRLGFFTGDLTISRRDGMVMSYELSRRHFGWRARPRPPRDDQVADYLLNRAVRAQAIVSLDSICYGALAMKPLVLQRIEAAVRRRRLLPVALDGHARVPHWIDPAALDESGAPLEDRVHILSPFDPLVIQRKRLEALFGYRHRFEAYRPADQRVLGYFALPVMVGDTVVAALDLKMDRQAGALLIRKWTWTAGERRDLTPMIEAALDRFEAFQKG